MLSFCHTCIRILLHVLLGFIITILPHAVLRMNIQVNRTLSGARSYIQGFHRRLLLETEATFPPAAD